MKESVKSFDDHRIYFGFVNAAAVCRRKFIAALREAFCFVEPRSAGKSEEGPD